MKKNAIKIFGTIIALSFLSCTNDSQDDLINSVQQQNITYTNTIKGVINNNCIICHTNPPQNGAPMSLNSYNLVIDAVLNRGLLERISKPQGDPDMMPFGGTRLPQSTINKFVEWAENDFPE